MAEEEKQQEKKKKSVQNPWFQDIPEPDPADFVDEGNYFVYGLAIGVLVGAVLFFLFGGNKILLCVATVIGVVVGALIKKKPSGNASKPGKHDEATENISADEES